MRLLALSQTGGGIVAAAEPEKDDGVENRSASKLRSRGNLQLEVEGMLRVRERRVAVV